MLPGDYIAYRFSNKINTTICGLSEGIFWDFKQDVTADFLLDYYGIDKSLVPDIVDTFGLQSVVDKKGANNCGFVLKTEDNKLYLPVDWLVPEYKVAGKVVYIKYIDSKAPQSGCNEATPIVIQEIKLIR